MDLLHFVTISGISFFETEVLTVCKDCLAPCLLWSSSGGIGHGNSIPYTLRTQSSSDLRRTCPNHLKRFRFTTSFMSSILSNWRSFLEATLSFRETPNIRRSILRSAVIITRWSSAFIAHVSLPYTIALYYTIAAGLDVLRYLPDFRYFDQLFIGSRDSLKNAIISNTYPPTPTFFQKQTFIVDEIHGRDEYWQLTNKRNLTSWACSGGTFSHRIFKFVMEFRLIDIRLYTVSVCDSAVHLRNYTHSRAHT